MNKSILYILVSLFVSYNIFALNADMYRAQAAYDYGYYDSVCLYTMQSSAVESKELHGKALYAMKQYDKAYTIFQSIETSESWYYRACICAISQQADSAVWYLQKHISSGAKKTYAEIIKNDAFESISKTPEWREFWKQSVYSDAELLVETIEYSIVHKSMQEVLQIIELTSVSSAEIVAYKAFVQSRMGEEKRASQILSQINPSTSSTKVLRIVANTFVELREYTKAYECMVRYVTICPNDITANFDIAHILYEMKKYNEAQKYLEFLLTYYYKHDAAWYMLSLVYQQQKQYLAALPCLHKACELAPANATYVFARAGLFLELKQFVQAEIDYNQCLDLQPNMYVYFNRAHARRMQGNVSGACYDYTRSYKLGNQDALYYSNLYCEKK
ncbi:MAG TPA: hypothetical protein PK199_04800 [Bacteroidales bacterium]|nr:hypothetical protein [Bacteroidales bacterium]